MTSDSYEQAEDFETDYEVGEEGEGWAIRPLMLALIGLAAGYGIHLIVGTDYSHTPTVMQFAELTAIIVGAGMFGLTVERRTFPLALVFSLICAATAAGIVWWNGNPDHWGGGDGWRMFSLAMSLAIAAPLFQAAFHDEDHGFDYAAVHDHAWTNIVLWVATCVFVGIVWALAWLLAALFKLIDIKFVEELLMKEWFARCLIGLAFGGGLGLLREHGFVVRLLQRVVTTVLSVLAPVLAVGLVMFLFALPFTGLAPLWKSVSATAILLVCASGALILANAVIGNSPEQARRFPVLRFGAMALSAVVLPLSVLAAVAIGLRINQYGFTPERLWALTYVVIATAFGVAYIVALVLGRTAFGERVRSSNLILAFGLCAVALMLATPLVSFNAIATRDQVARLESGKIAPDKFDWRALAFEFGQSGRDALKKLEASTNPAIKAKAVEVAKVDNKWDIPNGTEAYPTILPLDQRLRLLPQGHTLAADLRKLIEDDYACGRRGGNCTLFFVSSAEALLIQDGCFEPPAASTAPPSDRKVEVAVPSVAQSFCGSTVTRYLLADGKWSETSRRDGIASDSDRAKAAAGYKAGQVEIRPVTRKQLFVGGVPVDDAFE